MLVKLAKVREERSLPDAIAMAQEAGRKIRHHRKPGSRRQMSDDDAAALKTVPGA